MKTGATPVRTTYDNRIEVLTPIDNRPVKSAQVLTWHPVWKTNRFGMSCAPHLMLHPLFGFCSQSHEIRLNKGMKYSDSALNAPGSRTSIATLHIAAAVIS